MRGLNKVMLIGNLGKDPEEQTLEGGITVAKFSLATTESYKDDKGETHSLTEWHSIVAWRSLADLAGKYLKKGSTIYLEGKIKTRSYEDKEGNKKYVTEIIAESFIMLDKPADKAEINASF
ncbi:single-stranded DNA-binding protein [Thermoflexibacter ruber]|uniref:Single-stranded DNA-binding protein n=1 Tax=Thermoflexibacter ruber TaxID=1003 RepID=A0A1I2JES8_9BACT|nr:single-stranded DNA-binding protein [Thermoflexibacter ruber]SFF51677.1 single-strand binding protein [Thermoflexibacter ruber]